MGSSMGGYVTVAATGMHAVEGMFLMCPALYMPGYALQDYKPMCKNIVMIHGWDDDIVPFESTVKFGRQQLAAVHLVNDNHRLSASHDLLERLFEDFLNEMSLD